MLWACGLYCAVTIAMKSDHCRQAEEWLCSALSGIAVLGTLRILEQWMGFSVPLNMASLTTSAVLGLPGIVALLILRALFFKI